MGIPGMQSLKKEQSPIKFSIVLPIYNEIENLPQLFDEILTVLRNIDEPYEIICINDGSTDHSPAYIQKFAQDHPQFKLISFRKNQGQSAALSVGFIKAKGKYVITMDADLQNDPSDIIKLLDYLPKYDMVTGWRTKRHDTWLTKISSKIANSTRNMLTSENIHDTGCSLKIMKKSYLDRIKMFRGMHRFLPTLMKLEGAKVIEIPVNHRPRTRGVSNYGVWDRAFSGLRDLLAVRWMQDRHIHLDIKEEDK
jgi:glycosyltransferase involved in cell wall biosynthesis